jgi:hypothetical protein
MGKLLNRKPTNKSSSLSNQRLSRACIVHHDEERTKLRSAYKENLQLFVRRAAALILVPPELVEDVSFNALEDSDLYRSPGYKKNQLFLCKNYALQ